ncbi:MAG: biotin carboxylase N-terminal domain-containing protein [Candidatus Nanopelagicales bacterium]
MPERHRVQRLLVANRGEIARRIFRTARAMRIGTVAVYSDPDAAAPFVRESDVAVPLEGETSAATYLDIGKVIAAARRTGADAIHPGYGFLAENADAARAVVDSGLVWVGPTWEQTAAMSSKVAAKALVAAVGVPVMPSAEPSGDDQQDWLDAAAKVGFPLLVKASAGGGGKGMRLVHHPDGVVEGVRTAQREAAAAFGDDEVFLERWLSPSRHVEVQLLGDAYGTLVHLGERECSIQRRHQKIVEESPSPGITAATRTAICAAAVRAARVIDYVGAGTVEFLVTGEGDAQEFFFLEMNTRLQVEHAVTELVRPGLDLVREQLLIAMGQPLDVATLTSEPVGHAIEVRLYAEDPATGHVPSTGRIELFEPDGAVRWDSGVETGSTVSPFYDPMLAKAIAHGGTRDAAATLLASSLRRSRLHGVATNVASLVSILESAEFRAGATTTDFLERQPQLLDPALPASELTAHLVAAVLWCAASARSAAGACGFAPSGWRNVRGVPQHREFGLAGTTRTVDYDRTPIAVDHAETLMPMWTCTVDGVPNTATVHGVDESGIDLVFDGLRRRYDVAAYGEVEHRTLHVRTVAGESMLREVPRFMASVHEVASRGPTAPVPGTVIAVEVAAGEAVAGGQTLVRLEAMKMEHRITADADGVVEQVLVELGDSVEAHQVLIVLAAP